MLTRLRDFILRNKLTAGVVATAAVACIVTAVVFGVAYGNGGAPVSVDPAGTGTAGQTAANTDDLPTGGVTGGESAGESEKSATSGKEQSSGSVSKAASTTRAGDKAAVIGNTIYPADATKNGYTFHNVVGVDNLGRTFGAVSSDKSGRSVGMFAAAAEGLGEPELSVGVYDCTKILAMPNGLKLLTDPAHYDPEISPVWQPHFWAEPVWGYYRAGDEWVIRRQLTMLGMAGVDFIAYDVSNGIPDALHDFTKATNVYTKIMKAITELRKEGWDVPQITFYTHSRSHVVVKLLYDNLYKKNVYPDSWYRVNGKPFIIGYTNLEEEIYEAHVMRKDTAYQPVAHPKAVYDFFTWKTCQWPNEPQLANSLPWMTWVYPQLMHDGVMNVTAAAHPGVPMSFSLTRPGWKNWGRGYNPATGQNVTANVDKGSFYQLTWDTVHKSNPGTVFIGEWNEWSSMKQLWDGEYMLADEVNMEYSRDLEPMVGGFEDNFFMQTVQNVRKYKSNAGSVNGTKKAINIKSSAAQWKDVATVYRSIGASNMGRDSNGVAEDLFYKQDPARNNIQEVKMANDGENLYVYVRAEKALTAYDGKSANWMNILIGTGSVSQKGWKGFEYVVNRNPQDSGKTSVHKLDASGKASAAGSAEYTIDGNVMQVKIPMSVLGSGAKSGVYFKVADNVQNQSDIMNYYTTGKVLPLGRVSYEYKPVS